MRSKIYVERLRWPIAAAIFFIVFINVFGSHQISGTSMEPTISDGSRILTLKAGYGWFDIAHRGDVVVLDNPSTLIVATDSIVKRIVGIQGDTVEVKDGQMLVNGKVFVEDEMMGNFGPYTVQKDEIFVVGDNHMASEDSRKFGGLPKKAIVGRVFLSYGKNGVGLVL